MGEGRNKEIMNRQLLSVIVPCYNEAESLPLFYNEITRIIDKLPSMDTEVLFIDDGSTDDTLKIVKEFHEKNPQMQFISFSRNFGKEAAIFAGLEASRGDYVVLLDADLQHPPKYIPEMLDLVMTEGYDSAAMYRSTRKGERRMRSFFSRRFYKLINRISKTNLVEGATDYRLMTRQMVDSVLEMKEYNRFTKGIFSFVGFNTKWIPYENVERAAGITKWSFWGLLRYSLDGIIAFSTAPLTLCALFGFIFCLLAVIMAVVVVVKTLLWGDPVAGFPTLFCIIMMIGGVQLLFLGVQGQYISRMYLETKRRPIYIIKSSSTEK